MYQRTSLWPSNLWWQMSILSFSIYINKNQWRSIWRHNGDKWNEKPTETINNQDTLGGGTVIRHINHNATGETGVGHNRRLVGLLVSYSDKPTGEVYKVYEGRTTIGRDSSCDISFPNDNHMSSKHLLIQYVEAKGAFKAKDLGSSNGSNVNGSVYVMDETIDLKNNDKIVLGSTLLVFLAIPNL